MRALEVSRARSRSPETHGEVRHVSGAAYSKYRMTQPRRFMRSYQYGNSAFGKWRIDSKNMNILGASLYSPSSLSSKSYLKFVDRLSQYPNVHSSSKRSIEYEESPATGCEWNEMLTFRTFVIMKTQEETSSSQALEAYNSYKENFLKERESRFIWHIKDFPVIAEKYSPEMLQKEYELSSKKAKEEAAKFFKDLAEEQFVGIHMVEQISEYRTVEETEHSMSVTIETFDKLQDRSSHVAPLFLSDNPDLNCICLRKLPNLISKWDLFNYLLSQFQQENIVELTMSEPPDFQLTLQGGSPLRIAWIQLDSEESCNAAELRLERATLKNAKLHPLRRLPNPKAYIFQVTPSEAAHPARILRDLTLSAYLILKLDAEYEVVPYPDGNLFEHDLFESRCAEHPLLREFQQVFNGLSRSPEEQLDLQLLYLRNVYFVCYYSGRKFSSNRDMWNQIGALYVRPQVDTTEVARTLKGFESLDENGWDKYYIEARDLLNPIGLSAAVNSASQFSKSSSRLFERHVSDNTQSVKDKAKVKEESISENKEYAGRYEPFSEFEEHEIIKNEAMLDVITSSERGRNSEWLQILDSRIARLLSEDYKARCEPVTEEHPEVQKLWNEFCLKATDEISSQKWRCSLCSKMFRGAEFVKKHLKNKHFENMERIIEGVNDNIIVERFQADPFRHSLASPPVVPYLYRRGLPNYHVYEMTNTASTNNPSTGSNFNSNTNNVIAKEKFPSNNGYQYVDLDAPQPTSHSINQNVRETISYNDL